jgi:hypothetical protein
VQRGQPAVAGSDRSAPVAFDVVEKGGHIVRRQVRQGQPGDVPLPALGDKAQEETPAIAVRDDRVPRGIPLPGHPVVKVHVEQLR